MQIFGSIHGIHTRPAVSKQRTRDSRSPITTRLSTYVDHAVR